jgi:hypothetical protein
MLTRKIGFLHGRLMEANWLLLRIEMVSLNYISQTPMVVVSGD